MLLNYDGLNRSKNAKNKGEQKNIKPGCVIPMVIWPEFRMGKYRINDHPYHAPQLSKEHVEKNYACQSYNLEALIRVNPLQNWNHS